MSDITVYSCFQVEYVRNGRMTEGYYGFGDFLRGAYTLWSICKQYGLNFEVHNNNHPINKYIISKIKDVQISITVPIIVTQDAHYRQNELLVKHIFERLNEKNIYMMTNCFLKSRLETTDEFKSYYNEITGNIIPKSYSVIHVRNGDPVGDYGVSNSDLDKIDNFIKKINHDGDIYILGDNKFVTRYFSEKYNFKTLNTGEICHLGLRNSDSEDKLKNTLVDFYFIANSAKIYQLSVYDWISGFVLWPAKIYDVPIDYYKM